MMRYLYAPFIYALVAGLLLACASGGGGPGPASGPLPATVSKGSAKPVVVALAQDAQLAREQGRHEQAASYLERALRIEPADPWLWHRLARVRAEQGRNEQALNLARKSNALAGADAELRKANWAMIADALAALGQHDKAEAARRQAR